MEQIKEKVQALKSLMARLAGKGSHQAASFTQSRVLMQLIASTSLSVEEVVFLMDEVETIGFSADDQACIVQALTQKVSCSSAGVAIPAKGGKRQDYESLIYFCPTAFGKPALGKGAPSELFQFLADKLGMRNPTEGSLQTCTIILMVQGEGLETAMKYSNEAKANYLKCAKRWFQSAVDRSSAASLPFKDLPASPNDFQERFPSVYNDMFALEPPAPCKIDRVSVNMISAGKWLRLGKCNGSKVPASSAAGSYGEPSLANTLATVLGQLLQQNAMQPAIELVPQNIRSNRRQQMHHLLDDDRPARQPQQLVVYKPGSAIPPPPNDESIPLVDVQPNAESAASPDNARESVAFAEEVPEQSAVPSVDITQGSEDKDSHVSETHAEKEPAGAATTPAAVPGASPSKKPSVLHAAESIIDMMTKRTEERETKKGEKRKADAAARAAAKKAAKLAAAPAAPTTPKVTKVTKPPTKVTKPPTCEAPAVAKPPTCAAPIVTTKLCTAKMKLEDETTRLHWLARTGLTPGPKSKQFSYKKEGTKAGAKQNALDFLTQVCKDHGVDLPEHVF